MARRYARRIHFKRASRRGEKRASALRRDRIEIRSNRNNFVERAQILIWFAKHVPSKINKGGIPSQPLQAKASQALTDYCRLVGFPEDLLTGSSRPAYQQVFQFKKAFDEKKLMSGPLLPIQEMGTRYKCLSLELKVELR